MVKNNVIGLLFQSLLIFFLMKDCLKRCMELIRKGASVFFFPEGTRSKDGKLGAFKVSEHCILIFCDEIYTFFTNLVRLTRV